MRSSRRVHKFAVLLLAVAFIAAGCGSSSEPTASTEEDTSNPTSSTEETDNSASEIESGLIGDQPEATPVDGGTVTMGTFSPVQALDPTAVTGSGNAGGIELAALYGVLVRYDTEAGEYVPQMATSLEPNDDFSQWTLTLRGGVTFTDGTPYDAEAVVFNLKRHVEAKSRAGSMLAIVDSYETPDPQTVVINLSKPWSGFPFVLAWMGGMIASPTALQSMSPEEYNRNPVGAGPFMLDRFAPNEELVVTRNPDYWGGASHLDKLRFVYLPAASANLDALASGDLQAAFLRDPKVIKDAGAAGFPGYLSLKNAGLTVLINNGTQGQDRATSDVRVRKAIAMAMRPDAYDDRAYAGAGYPTRDMMGPASRWHTESSLETDPEQAKKLLAEVTEETDWDGSLTMVTSESGRRGALATQAQLEAVGFQVELDIATTISDLIRKIVIDADYDIAAWGFNIDEAEPYVTFAQRFLSTSPTNVNGYQSEEMDRLITELRGAPTDEETQQILDEMQQVWDETVPAVVLGQQPEFIAWNADLHGVVPTVTTMVLFHEAFLAK